MIAAGVVMSVYGVYSMLLSEQEPSVRTLIELPGGPVLLLLGITLALLSPALYVVMSGRSGVKQEIR